MFDSLPAGGGCPTPTVIEPEVVDRSGLNKANIRKTIDLMRMSFNESGEHVGLVFKEQRARLFFNMTHWFDDRWSRPTRRNMECGTTACLAGWAAIALHGYDVVAKGYGGMAYSSAVGGLGVSDEVASELFRGSWSWARAEDGIAMLEWLLTMNEPPEPDQVTAKWMAVGGERASW